MEILLHIDLFYKYINDKLSGNIDEETNLLRNIFDRLDDNMKIILTNAIVNELDNLLTNAIVKEIFKNFIPKFINTRANTNYSNTKTGKDDIFRELSDLNTCDCFIKIAKTDINIPETIVFEKRLKPNIHWWKLQLVAYGHFTLRHHDFSQQSDITNFFKEAFTSYRYNVVNLFDRYRNITSHNNFSYLNSISGLRINYYTFTEEGQRIVPGVINDIDIDLGAGTKIYVTSNRDWLHERKLIFGHFMLESDDDFANVNISRNTWKLDLSYSKELCNKQMEKITEFDEYNYSS